MSGENQDRIAPIGRFSCKGKTPAKTRFLRQRENIKESNNQKIRQSLNPPSEESDLRRGIPHFLQPLAHHRNRQMVSEACRQCRQDKGNVYLRNVVCHKQYGAF